MDTSRVDVERMAREEEISLYRIKSALGIPLEPHPATTLEQARSAYFDTPHDTEEQRVAFERWLNLCATRQEVYEMFKEIPEHLEEALIVFERWLGFHPPLEELHEAYLDAPGIEGNRALIRKMAEFYTTG